MKVVLMLGVALLALSTVSACENGDCECGGEMGKCGCCPWPCCCVCECIEVPCPCIDLAFIIDASGTITDDQWQEVLHFLDDVTQLVVDGLNYEQCGSQVNVGMVTFGTNATLQFDWSPYNSGQILGVQQTKTFSNLVDGMQVAIEELFDVESDCEPFAVVLTDGRVNIRENELASMGTALRAAVEDNIACIGVTSQVDMGQMADICPAAGTILEVNSFTELKTLILNSVADMIGNSVVVDCSEEECFCCCPPPELLGYGGHY